jgi:hypothetical protein
MGAKYPVLLPPRVCLLSPQAFCILLGRVDGGFHSFLLRRRGFAG